jgi:hypothetical protein
VPVEEDIHCSTIALGDGVDQIFVCGRAKRSLLPVGRIDIDDVEHVPSPLSPC